MTGSWDIYKLALSNDLWFHEYIVTAKDLAWNSSTANISYNVVADSVLNINILWYNISNLTATWIIITWTTDKIASESLVDFYANWTQLLNQVATISWTLNTLAVNNLTPNKIYSVVIKSRTSWQQNFTTLTIVIKTSFSNNWLIVNKIENVLWDSIVGWGFENWYHFKFTVTANDLSENGVTLKLADWSNWLGALPIASNTLMSISSNWFKDYNSAVWSVTTVTNNYWEMQNIGSIDSDPQLWGRQFIIDLFYRIPIWAQWVYSTTYWIKTQ